MWWQNLLWGFWNGLTAWIILIAHLFGGWQEYPFYHIARGGNWYDFGFLLGAGSPFLGAINAGKRRAVRVDGNLPAARESQFIDAGIPSA